MIVNQTPVAYRLVQHDDGSIHLAGLIPWYNEFNMTGGYHWQELPFLHEGDENVRKNDGRTSNGISG